MKLANGFALKNLSEAYKLNTSSYNAGAKEAVVGL